MDNLSMVATAQNDYALTPVVSVEQAKEQLRRLQEFVQEVMVKGEDYGTIPGTPKPTLLKPGAEKLCEIYALAPTVEVTHRIEDWEQGFFHYEVRMRLVSKRTGAIVAEGVGSANSREGRYAARWIPEWKLRGQDVSGLASRVRSNAQGEYLEYKVPNDDPYTLVNTLLKMAKKRALIDATLSATRSSGLFTQDVEDVLDSEGDDSGAKAAPSSRRSQSGRQIVGPQNRENRTQENRTQGDPTQGIPQEAYEIGAQIGWIPAKVRARYMSFVAAGKTLEEFMTDLKSQAAGRIKSVS